MERLKEELIAKHLQHQKEADQTRLNFQNQQKTSEEEFLTRLKELKSKSLEDVAVRQQAWHEMMKVSF